MIDFNFSKDCFLVNCNGLILFFLYTVLVIVLINTMFRVFIICAYSQMYWYLQFVFNRFRMFVHYQISVILCFFNISFLSLRTCTNVSYVIENWLFLFFATKSYNLEKKLICVDSLLFKFWNLRNFNPWFWDLSFPR